MQRILMIIFVASISFNSSFGLTPKGTIKGKVVNIANKEVLIGANVLLRGTELGAITDIKGEFVLNNVPAGNYSIECRYVGFETTIKTDILVKPDRITFTDFELREQSIKVNDVTVTAGYFQVNDVVPAGYTSINNQEIRRAAGSAMDVSRILLALPSTSKTSDDANDLAVRGGSSSENGFYVDNIPVPNINFFPSEGATGGPVGILDVNFIENVNFYTGGFEASYGDRLSSVVDIQLREGNKEQNNFQLGLNMTGFSGLGEGPLPGNNGSWMFSAQKSYVDLLVGALGTGVAPRYGDLQTKIVYNINSSQKISLMEIFAKSSIDLPRDKAIDKKSAWYGENNNTQNTIGINWTAIWNKNLYSNTSFSYSLLDIKANLFKVLSKQIIQNSDNNESMIVLRNVNYLQMNKSNKFEFGFEIKNEFGKFNESRGIDTNRLEIIIPAQKILANTSPVISGLFLNYITNPFDPLTISLGLRSDYYSLNRKVPFSPRVFITYAVNNQLKVYTNGGIFYQELPMIILSSNPKFNALHNVTATHYGVGAEYLLTPDTKLTLEAYYKGYKNLPLDSNDPTLSIIDQGLSNQRFGLYSSLHSIGKAHSEGIELSLQKKLAKDIYGLVSGTYFRSKYQDYEGKWHNRIYDNRYIFSIIGGYQPNNNWEFTLKWIYAGGCPYTPYDITLSQNLGTGIIDQTQINNARYSDYHTLNLGVEKKFFYNKNSLNLYFTVMNVYNRKNISSYYWNVIENKQGTFYQWSLLPIIGIEYDF